MKKSKDKIDEKILKDIESKLSLKKGLKEEDLLEDIDKIENEIEDFGINIREKYKEYLPKEDLDSKK